MARILLTTIPIAGHVSPLLGVARGLVQQGHEVLWYTGSKYQALARSSGARTMSFEHARDFDDAAFDQAFAGRVTLRGLSQLRFDLREIFVGGVPGQLADLGAIAESFAPDLLLMDPGLVGGVLHGELSGTPYVIMGVVPLLCTSRDTAPFGTGLEPLPGPLGPYRNGLLKLLVQRVLLRDVQTRWDQLRAKVGLPATGWWIDASIAGAALYLQPTVPGFEYPRRDLPPNVRFIGPLPARPSLAAEHPDFWHELEAGRPVVHVTQGTLANTAPNLIAPAIAGLASEDLLVVIATGGREPQSLGLERLPKNVRVSRFLDYARFLPKVSVMVTNGGYGGVQLALSQGVPLVVAGVTEDKAEVAARVAWSGAGVNLRTERPSPRAVRKAVARVLDTPSYRERARALAAEYARYDAVNNAVRCIESIAGLRPSSLRTTSCDGATV